MTGHAWSACVLFALALDARAPHATLAPAMGEAWGAEWSAHDLERVMIFYAPDAIFFTINRRVQGTREIRRLFRQTLDTYSPTIRMHRTFFGESGDLAHESGEFDETLRDNATRRHTHGYYLLVMRRAAGRWRIVQQMWTEADTSD